MTTEYKCKKCGWQGTYQQLDFDSTETCMGDDQIEMCPECGSYEVVIVPKNKTSDSA